MIASDSRREYRRSPFCLLHWEGTSLHVRNCDTSREFRGAERYFAILDQLSEWTGASELRGRVNGYADVPSLERALERLVRMELVIERTDDASESPAALSGEAPKWNLIDLAFQRQGIRGGYDPTVPKETPAPSAYKPVPDAPAIALPRAGLDDDLSLRAVLAARRSVRTYADRPVALHELGRFLYAAARVVRAGVNPVLGEFTKRPSPSGGARHALEIYPVCNDVDGLAPGAYYYHPRENALYLTRPADEWQSVITKHTHTCTGDALNRDPPVVLLVTAVFARTMWKYDNIALSIILKDLGALYQTMYLVATALGLAPCAIGGAMESENARWLGLDPLVESQVGCFLLGQREAPPAPS